MASPNDTTTSGEPPPVGEPAPARVAAWRRLTQRPGLAGRLLLAAAVPILIVAIGSSVVLTNRHDDADAASAVASQVSGLNAYVHLRSLLDEERIPTEGVLRAQQFGLDIVNISSYFGFADVGTAQARNATDRALARLPEIDRAPLATKLDAVRTIADNGNVAVTTIDAAYAAISNYVAALFTARVVQLERRTANIPQGSRLNRSLVALSDANEALGAGTQESAALSDLWLATSGQRPAQLSMLGGDVALYQQAATRLDGDSGAIHATWEHVAHSEPDVYLQQMSAAAAAGAPPPLAPGVHGLTALYTLAPIFTQNQTVSIGFYQLVDRAEMQLSQAATQLSNSSEMTFVQLLVLTLLALLVPIVIAFLLARAITARLDVLAVHARAVQAGDLDVDPLPLTGAREASVVYEAFNSLVSNLRLMEAKARALASCDFDDPVLQEVLPGRLGAALQESVSVLSGSIGARDTLQQTLLHQATHDALTGLHNRAAAIEALEHALARSARSGGNVAVLFIDLDDFKRANDTHGHSAGDELLTEIANRMAAIARRGDVLARLGGDEFLLIAEGAADVTEATTLAGRIIEVTAEPITLADTRITISACVGIAFATDATEDASQLMAHADLAVYRAKRAGKSKIEIYDESLQSGLIARAAVERDLAQALDEGGRGLSLHYQPVIDAATGTLRSVEALVRWERDGYGHCLPADFIPHAEASDLIVKLDCWVLEAAIKQLATWNRDGLQRLNLAVNISGRHLLSGSLAPHVIRALSAEDVLPESLIVELTETVLLADLGSAAAELDRLRQRGVKIAIDDFGTGYTSLAHLQHFTVDAIKIDRSFVAQLPQGRDSSLVRMVTDMAHHFGVTIVAEGVETDAQLAALREIGADAIQGFLIARPMPADDFLEWRAAWPITWAS